MHSRHLLVFVVAFVGCATLSRAPACVNPVTQQGTLDLDQVRETMAGRTRAGAVARFRGMVASPARVRGGEAVRLTFYLSRAAPDGGVILELTKTEGLRPPRKVTIPSGATQLAVSLPTCRVMSPTAISICYTETAPVPKQSRKVREVIVTLQPAQEIIQ